MFQFFALGLVVSNVFGECITKWCKVVSLQGLSSAALGRSLAKKDDSKRGVAVSSSFFKRTISLDKVSFSLIVNSKRDFESCISSDHFLFSESINCFNSSKEASNFWFSALLISCAFLAALTSISLASSINFDNL
uniref:Uncharacterized protein n=1 Tax=Romanomermis culicivorax TaxID=13658 RepID=A0A915L7W4_ROMCU